MKTGLVGELVYLKSHEKRYRLKTRTIINVSNELLSGNASSSKSNVPLEFTECGARWRETDPDKYITLDSAAPPLDNNSWVAQW